MSSLADDRAMHDMLFIVCLSFHATIPIWSMRSWESVRPKNLRGRGSDSQGRMGQIIILTGCG